MSRPWRTYRLKLPEEVALAYERALAYGRCLELSNDTETFEAMCVGFCLEHEVSVQQQSSVYQSTRLQVYDETGYRCLLCKHSKGLQMHHIIPKGAKGSDIWREFMDTYGTIDHVANLAPLCAGCHAKIQPHWRRYVKPLLILKDEAIAEVARKGYRSK